MDLWLGFDEIDAIVVSLLLRVLLRICPIEITIFYIYQYLLLLVTPALPLVDAEAA